MPPKLLFDIAGIDLDRVIFDQAAIREMNLQRGNMEHLNGILFVDTEQDHIIGYKDVRTDEFWVEGHIPGRPLLPGVVMIEAAGQVASFYARKFMGWTGFVGFGGVDNCKFRLAIAPPARMYLLAKKRWERHGRLCCGVQGVFKGDVAFEAEVTGLKMAE